MNKQNHIFQLYDCIVKRHVSYHKTLKGALIAMRDALDKLTPALCQDYKEDENVNFTLKYRIKTHKVLE